MPTATELTREVSESALQKLHSVCYFIESNSECLGWDMILHHHSKYVLQAYCFYNCCTRVCKEKQIFLLASSFASCMLKHISYSPKDQV